MSGRGRAGNDADGAEGGAPWPLPDHILEPKSRRRICQPNVLELKGVSVEVEVDHLVEHFKFGREVRIIDIALDQAHDEWFKWIDDVRLAFLLVDACKVGLLVSLHGMAHEVVLIKRSKTGSHASWWMLGSLQCTRSRI